MKDVKQGKIFVVGIGPGEGAHITPAAAAAIEQADSVVGYKAYLELIRDRLNGKAVVGTGMRRELERCRTAVELAREGRSVVVISSGDAGIYGMAGLVLELADGADVEIIPGISAVNAAAALLGAPLMHDFAVISLSDLLTDWELIQRRLDAAASADFVIALYNPRSRQRREHIIQAVHIISQHRSGVTPVGIVRNAYREGQRVLTAPLNSLPYDDIDMLTILIIGNSQTRLMGGYMVTPRGYLK